MTKRIATYSEFWRFYVGEHRNKTNRNLHFLGTNLVIICMVVAAETRNLNLVFLSLLLGYGPAWIGHFFVEKNRPATFRYPIWSLVADFQMWAYMWLGRMDREVARNNLITSEDY